MRRVLVDTSVWVDHLKNGNAELLRLIALHRLNQLVVLGHYLVYSELLLGGLDQHNQVYLLFKKITSSKSATLEEFETFVRNNKDKILGIGVIDAHLLISCIIDHAMIFTYYRSLKSAAERFDVLFR